MLTDQPPQSLLRAMYATLTDKYYGFASLGLASLTRTAANLRAALASSPDIDGVATTERRSSRWSACGSRSGARRRAASGSRR